MTQTTLLRIRGRVQGVGFRAWAVAAARAEGVEGWVRNRADGTVEALVTGAPDNVARFIERCRRGPAAASVAHVGVSPGHDTSEPLSGFHQRPTL